MSLTDVSFPQETLWTREKMTTLHRPKSVSPGTEGKHSCLSTPEIRRRGFGQLERSNFLLSSSLLSEDEH